MRDGCLKTPHPVKYPCHFMSGKTYPNEVVAVLAVDIHGVLLVGDRFGLAASRRVGSDHRSDRGQKKTGRGEKTAHIERMVVKCLCGMAILVRCAQTIYSETFCISLLDVSEVAGPFTPGFLNCRCTPVSLMKSADIQSS